MGLPESGDIDQALHAGVGGIGDTPVPGQVTGGYPAGQGGPVGPVVPAVFDVHAGDVPLGGPVDRLVLVDLPALPHLAWPH